jgi:Fic family protein
MIASSAYSLPWWEKDEGRDALRTGIATAKELMATNPTMDKFKKHSVLTGVLLTNKLEKTLPQGLEDMFTYRLMEEQYNTSLDLNSEFVEPACTWLAEGGVDKAKGRQQMLQSVKAVQYLFSTLPGPLTLSTIRTTHKILMWGAIEDDGSPVAAGEYRSTPAHSGTGYIYPDADAVPSMLSKVVEDYNESFNNGQDPCALAAELLYKVLVVHPFQNGNGRLCRLLASYAAMAAGEPFMLILSDGHSKAQQQYQQVLRHADKYGHRERLHSFVLECLHRQWKNALAYAGMLS